MIRLEMDFSWRFISSLSVNVLEKLTLVFVVKDADSHYCMRKIDGKRSGTPFGNIKNLANMKSKLS